mmetsp:Transcript_26163/g.56404  ORF Transcript_26163/g.56404 Transcript_26163/m.56404 type:complete len:87 (+) Transcript_26163:1386-1646(+)
MGKFAFSSVLYRRKKYFMANRPRGPRLSITFCGTEKCCIRDVPPHLGTWTKKRCSESGTSFSGVDLISHGIPLLDIGYWLMAIGVF